jgi:hypothetical protein
LGPEVKLMIDVDAEDDVLRDGEDLVSENRRSRCRSVLKCDDDF